MESIRKLEKVSGYQWWLLVDYWGTSNGVLDAWWTPKLAPDGMAQIRSINNEVQYEYITPHDHAAKRPAVITVVT